MTHSLLTNGIQLTSDNDSRNGRKVDRFIVHHAATTSLSAILELFQPGGREVSANYALGSDGTLILAVDEDRSAWTSASWYDDRAITIEVANSQAGGSWPVSDAAFDKLARLIADVSIRYGFPVNDDTVLTHQELYIRFGESYPTACPGDLQRRKAELLTRANTYRNTAPANYPTATPIRTDDDEMFSPEAQAFITKSITHATTANVYRSPNGSIALADVTKGYWREFANMGDYRTFQALGIMDPDEEITPVDAGTYAGIKAECALAAQQFAKFQAAAK